MSTPLNLARIASRTNPPNSVTFAGQTYPQELYSVSISLAESKELFQSKLNALCRSGADIIICKYDGEQHCSPVFIPPTHRHVGSVCLDEQHNLVFSKVRLTPGMLLSVFPTSPTDLTTKLNVYNPPRASVAVTTLTYLEPESFSEPNELDAENMYKFTIDKKKFGVYLSEDFESKYPNGKHKEQWAGGRDKTIMGTIYAPTEFASVELTSVSRSIVLVFFRDAGSDAAKFNERKSAHTPDYQRFVELFRGMRALLWSPAEAPPLPKAPLPKRTRKA